MKRSLLLFSLLLCFIANGQTIIFSQDFEASKTSIPAGWHQQLSAYAPSNFGWFFTTNPGGYLGTYYIPNHTYYACVDDDDYNYPSTQLNYDTLYTPSINLTTYSQVYISFDVWFAGLYDTNSATDAEQSNLAVSTDGGKTWYTFDTIHGVDNNNWRTLTFDVSAYAGMPNVMFAFTYTDGGYCDFGEGIDNVMLFVPLGYDVGVTQQNLPYLCQVGKPYTISGALHNYGANTVTGMHLKYSVNGGPAISDNLSFLSIPSIGNYNFTHSIPWIPTVTGNNIVKIWADTLNGSNPDQKHMNDTLTALFVVVDSIQPKEPLMEEFTQASCSPCLYFTPQLDSLMDSVKAFCNPIRYHVNWPARDFMNNVTQPFVGQRVAFYNVPGVPSPYIDGGVNYPFSYAGILQEANVGSPFKITITNATYNTITNKYDVYVDIKSYAIFPAGLTAQVALTVDTMKFKQDQSLAEPKSYFEPPIGVTFGGAPDYLYPYSLNYPQVVENMMPDGNGTLLNSFTIGQTQALHLSWVKSHAWADSNKVWLYDSVGSHITVFIQNDTSRYVYQSAVALPSMATGINEVSDITYFNVYPNPTSGNATMAFSLKQDEPVSIEMYNMMGEKIRSQNEGTMPAGGHQIVIENKGLPAGIYFIRLITNNGFTDTKLVIDK